MGRLSVTGTIALGSLFSLCKAESYPTCGDCWCVPPSDGLGECPTWIPQTTFDNSVIDAYAAQIPTSWFKLDCNPYDNSTCTTTPTQSYLDDDEAVCGFLYHDIDCGSYDIITYSSRMDAIKAGAMITHTGSCGLCSTTQDLSIYLSMSLRNMLISMLFLTICSIQLKTSLSLEKYAQQRDLLTSKLAWNVTWTLGSHLSARRYGIMMGSTMGRPVGPHVWARSQPLITALRLHAS
jgi:hypothetical protein